MILPALALQELQITLKYGFIKDPEDELHCLSDINTFLTPSEDSNDALEPVSQIFIP